MGEKKKDVTASELEVAEFEFPFLRLGQYSEWITEDSVSNSKGKAQFSLAES